MTEYLSLKEAQEHLGTSRTVMWRLVRSGTLPTYSDPLDKRKKLVTREDVDKLKLPIPKDSKG